MALISCSECGKQVSDKASTCPNCGAPVVVPSRRGAAFVIDEHAPPIDPTTAVVFQHPNTGQTADISSAGVYTLLFGFFYFAVKGIWTHAVVGFILAILTGGITWLIYPFFSKKIVRNHLLANGWKAIK